MFGTLNRCWRPFTKEDYELSEEMLDYWTNFMKKGNPNTEGMEDWAPYTAKNPFVKILDI
jgi:para-nitrobenzyl esterase